MASYNHNPFLVLSNSTLASDIEEVTIRLRTAENKLKDTLYIMPTSKTFIFDDILELFQLFDIHTNGSVNIADDVYMGESMKLHLKINIMYFWTGAEYPPRFSLEVKKNADILFRISKGITDSTDEMNKMYEDLLIDLSRGDQLKITIFKDQIETHDSIMILKNSYISIGIV